MSSITITNQSFSTNPSRRIVLNRRGRLARTLVVLSLAIVAASVAGGAAGASTSEKAVSSTHFVTVTVAPGETLWSLANRISDGRGVHALIADIVEANNLDSVDVAAGDQIRIPLSR
jgi:LysM repeat protein